MPNNIILKWGTVKGWDFESTHSEIFKMLQKYLDGASLSCACDRPDKNRKELLCEIIDMIDGEIKNDWTGKIMSKDEAKEYIMSYDTK